MHRSESNKSKSPAKELVGKVWTDWIKNWLDLRGYLKQRRIVLAHPNLQFTEQDTRLPSWKTPFLFAVQGILLTALVIGLIGGAFSTLIDPRPTVVFRVQISDNSATLVPEQVPGGAEWQTKAELIEQDIAKLQLQLPNIEAAEPEAKFPGPVPYSDRDRPNLFALGVALTLIEMERDDAIAKYKQELEGLQEQLRVIKLAPRIRKAEQALQKVLMPVSLVFAAYLFRFLVRLRSGTNVALTHNAHVVYLYYFTAATFWVNVTLAVLVAIRANVSKYFPPQTSQIVEDLDAVLWSIDGVTKVTWSMIWNSSLHFAFALVAVWGYFVIRRVASGLREPFGLQSSSSRWQFYTGAAKLRKDLIIANLLSVILISMLSEMLSLAYAFSSEWLETYRI